MTDYITLNGFKQRLGITTSEKDIRILEHITAASRRVDGFCHRQFGPHVGAATVRYFRPDGWHTVQLDDATEVTSVAVDQGDAGSYTEAWTVTTDYEVEPVNGIGPDGQTGWPITALRAVGNLWFPRANAHLAVKVTGKWGWAAIPTAVVEATYLLAHRLHYEVSVPGGVTVPNPEFGVPGSPLRRPYTAEDLLAPYARVDKVIGVAG